MPNLRVAKSVPTLRATNAVPHLRLTTLAKGAGGSSSSVTFGGKGYPIGLLLAITADRSHTVTNTTTTTSSPYKPHMRITN